MNTYSLFLTLLYYAVKFGSCTIEKSTFGDNSAGVPAYRGHTQITSSCVASDNCRNSVHVISTYKTHLQHPGATIRPETVEVHVSVTGDDDKPLILVLTSYYPINWRLNIPDSVVFDKIILVRDKLSIVFNASVYRLSDNNYMQYCV